jgi:molybdenum cofactor cytidylyltransferase
VKSDKKQISAIVLAAGLSSRMGEQKLLLPWQGSTVIGRVVDTLLSASIEDVIVVTGRDANLVTAELRSRQATLVFNPHYSNGNMVDSLKTGILAMNECNEAFLLVLGDQPQMEVDTVHRVVHAWCNHPQLLCIPSWNMRRGHPWVVPAAFCKEILQLPDGKTMRDFLSAHSAQIHYVLVETPTILADLDTREEYDAAIKGMKLTGRKENKD